MSFNSELWFALSPWGRLLCWVISTLCGVLLMWWLFIQPVQYAQARVLAQQTGQQQLWQVQWRKLRALIPPTALPPLPPIRVFSPLDLQAPDRQLIRWQPALGGGELMLESRWPQVVETFSLLAERGMLIPAFSLVASDGVLHFTLQLEHDDGR